MRALPEWHDEDRVDSGLKQLLLDMGQAPLVNEGDINLLVDRGGYLLGRNPWTLSNNQIEVLQGLADGMTMKEIEAARGVKGGNSSLHLARARARLRCKTTQQTVAVAVASGLVRAPERKVTGGRLTTKRVRNSSYAVLKRIALGDSNSEIASNLGIGVESVKSHIAYLLEVMGARNRTHAVTIAFVTGLLVHNDCKHKAKEEE